MKLSETERPLNFNNSGGRPREAADFRSDAGGDYRLKLNDATSN
jgi:hypothetical protein